MVKNVQKVVPTSYEAPNVAFVEMEIVEAVLQLSGNLEDYGSENWVVEE